jgi:hypothetical protein
VIEEEAAED